ncbi:hypothetical protein C8R43DRAFT_1169232 [Mycena crocata]|nr:hypothetical protein C8R43DRAFT_1169232 [Mycena crocata]
MFLDVLRHPTPRIPTTVQTPEPNDPGSDSDLWDPSEPSSSPPKLSLVGDFDDELVQLVDVAQLATDLASGQFSTIASLQTTPVLRPPTPDEDLYISPEWLPSFVHDFLALGKNTPDVQGNSDQIQVGDEEFCVLLGIYTATVSRTVVYPPEQTAALYFHRGSFSVQQFLRIIYDHDPAAGGYILRALSLSSSGRDKDSCVVAAALDFDPYAEPRSEYEELVPLKDCLTAATAQLVIKPIPDNSCLHFRSEHCIAPGVNIYSIYILQPTVSTFDSVPSFLTARYAYERDLLDFLPQGGFGVAYVHYARYRILSRIADEIGLQINRPSHTSVVSRVNLTLPSLLEWAGVNAGSFGNEKGLIIRCEQIQHELSRQAISGGHAILLDHLNALATEPVRPMLTRGPSQGWSVSELRRHLPAPAIGGPRRRN